MDQRSYSDIFLYRQITTYSTDRVTGWKSSHVFCAISPKTRVVVITVREDLAVRATAMAIGSVAFLMKPFDGEKFIAAVREVLN
jgi:FixJ family two-component response regulator